jgi:hypothetical protein
MSCPAKGDSTVPTRVIDVGRADGSCEIKLQVTNRQRGAWVALSHCWGISAQYTTTTANLGDHRKAIRFEGLPRTFQDAITVTRKLGYEFLWIDSLCMHQYYKNAVLTIAADVARGDHEGFLASEREPSSFDPDLNHPQENLDHLHIRPITFCPDFSDDTPLSKRAWTLQEDILSSRTLHYTKEQLVWECQACKYTEGDISERGIRGNYDNAAMKRFFFTPGRGEDPHRALCAFDPFDVMHRWYSLVESFMRREITFGNDALPAISAIAREIRKLSGHTYVAGIWIEDLRGLLWSTSGCSIATEQYRAPSWSWASSNIVSLLGGLKYKSKVVKDLECHANILDYHIETADEDPFGRLKSGYLLIQGRALGASRWKGMPFYFNIPKASEYKPKKGQPICQFDIIPEHLFRRRLNIPETDESDDLSMERDEWDLNKEVAHLMLQDVTFLQVLTLTNPDPYWYGKTQALMLRANEDGATFRRVGIVELPGCKDLLTEDGWETQTFTIV